MRKVKTFKTGSPLSSLGIFVVRATKEITGKKQGSELPATVRVTVETVKHELAIDGVLADLALEDARADVMRFLDYRRDEKKKPILSVRALKRMLNDFATVPSLLKVAIAESMKEDWLGLFIRETGRESREIDRGKKSQGGMW